MFKTRHLIEQLTYRNNSILTTEIIFHNVQVILIPIYYKLSSFC